MFPIVEIFTSIQGEGCNLGKPANFIRFAGCNLRCPWCDTEWKEPKLGYLSVEEIIDKLDKRVKLVVLTGGEPMLQTNLEKLILALMRRHYSVSIETNGTKPTARLKQHFPDLWITCSPKPAADWRITPGCFYDELKYVVDGQLTKDKIEHTNKPIWLQPEGSNMQEAWQKALQMQKEMLGLGLDVRIGVQLHKIIDVR